MDPENPDTAAEQILRRAEADAMEHPPPRRPWKRPWWYRGFAGREFDWLDAVALTVLAVTVLLIILGVAGVL